MRRRIVIVSDKMQRGYRYVLSAAGRDFDPQFRPDLTPKQMLELGVFCGKYLTDCRDEFPASWFARAKLSPSGRDLLNYFGVDASQRLSEWRERAGYIRTIRAAGSSGIADTKTRDRSGAGRPSVDTSHKSGSIANRATRLAGRASARRCYIGPTTAVDFRRHVVSAPPFWLKRAVLALPKTSGVPEHPYY